MKIMKRNGKEVKFNKTKIEEAIRKANTSVDQFEQATPLQITMIATYIECICKDMNHIPTVEDIQDMVEDKLIQFDRIKLSKNYTKYRYKRELARKANTTDNQILSLLDCANEDVKQENSNKNPTIASTQRDYMAGEVSKDLSKRLLLPADVVQAHEDGILHFHDMDYFSQRIKNCCLINLDDMLQNGTVISKTMIERPKSFLTACTIATHIVAQVASNQYGGQTFSLAHLAKFVDVSRKKIRKQVEEELEGIPCTRKEMDRITETRLRREIKAGIQEIQYQLITLMTTNGQAPFVTMCLYLNEAKDEREKKDLAMCIEEVLNQRILGVKNEKGVYITPAFPKLVYVLQENNIKQGMEYFYLTELAAKCTAKRMVPDYVSEKIMMTLKGDIFPCMGCRSFLTPDRFTDAGIGNIASALNYVEGEHKYYGRFNQGVVTINLPDVALSSRKDMEQFWKIFDERLELCHKALRCRHERLKGTLSDISPIHWQHGAIARLKPGEPIDKLLYDGYSTISLGYAGLYECVKYMTGKSHTIEKTFALSVMQHLNDACAKWKEEENIDYSVYGTPLESTTYKFAKCLKKRFGVIDGVTNKNYITNSYHVHVTEPINAFDKLKFESEFQPLSPGGAISYVEVPNMQNNIPAVIALIQCIYDNIMYAELNTKSDYCQECGYDGEIQIVEDEDGKLLWECPNCGNRDQNKINVSRRTCGYIGTQYWNQGRTQELKDRTLHLSTRSDVSIKDF